MSDITELLIERDKRRAYADMSTEDLKQLLGIRKIQCDWPKVRRIEAELARRRRTIWEPDIKES